MLRRIGMATVTTVAAIAATAGFNTQASAAPADSMLNSSVVAKKSTISCEGQTFNHGGLVFNLGPRMGYTFGMRDGKVRMVKVFTNNGSSANFGLGAISWSGAVVESWSSGPSYCITFPGSSKGVVVKGKQGGDSWSTTHRW